MSSLSTLPKGDSAWLLRKSIQRIMQQVSVLETNIGSSTTGNSSNTQIIFNDAGTLRGDSGLTYNKTTDLLSVGAATISGDLTVDTNVLKVDSANNRVGVNTASPATDLEVRSIVFTEGTIRLYSAIDGSTASPKGSYFSFRSGTLGGGTETARLSSLNRFSNVLGGDFSISTADTSNVLQNRLTIDSGGVFTFAVGGSTAMTLNSTGLGVGVSPGYKLDVAGSSAGVLRLVNINNLSTDPAAVTRLSLDGQGATWHLDNERTNGIFKITRNSTACLTIDNSANVGIGVSPAVKLDIGGTGSQQFRIQMSGQADTRVISDTGAGIIGTYSNHQLIIRSNSITAITVDTSQNVGIGVVPGYKLDVNGTGKASSGWGVGDSSGNLSGTFINESNVSKSLTINADPGNAGANSLMQFKVDGSTHLTIDSSGNLGIGVAPSAWNAAYKAIEIGSSGPSLSFTSGISDLGQNAFFGSSWTYKATAAASLYRQQAGQHQWFNAPSGTAGTAITFTQAMTLDANGNLILQSSATPATLTTNGQLTVNATSNTNLRFSYRGSDGVTRVANITLA